MEHDFEGLGRRTMLLNARRLEQDASGAQLILLAIEDITARKQAEQLLAQSHAQLQEHTNELTRFNEVAVGRELRMIELKKEVNELCRRSNQSPRYPLEFEQDGKRTNV